MGVMHPCNYPGCMKKFDRKYNLKCHFRIHSNEKPYRCHHENCTRSFRWKSSLNHHLMSLDHTPPAVRRARKARAQRRRMARTSPHTFLPQQPLDHQPLDHQPLDHQPQPPVFDLPTLSPVSSVATFPHTPSPHHRTVPDIPPTHPQHFKLEHRLHPADVSHSSVASTPLSPAQDLQFLNRNCHIHHNHPTHPTPNHATPPVYTHTAPYRAPQSQLLHSGPRLHSQPDASPKIQTHHPIMAHLHDPLALSVKPLQHPLIPDSAVKNELRVFAEESTRCASEAETSIHTPTDDTLSMVTPTKRSDPMEFNSAAKLHMGAELVTVFDSSTGSTRDNGYSKLQGHKTAPPLISIFEEFSPVSLMPFPSSLESLFVANVDGPGMKSF